jgi:hypothetical protein
MRKVTVATVMSFAGGTAASLRLLETRPREGSENVLLRYAVRG